MKLALLIVLLIFLTCAEHTILVNSKWVLSDSNNEKLSALIEDDYYLHFKTKKLIEGYNNKNSFEFSYYAKSNRRIRIEGYSALSNSPFTSRKDMQRKSEFMIALLKVNQYSLNNGRRLILKGPDFILEFRPAQ